MNVFPFKKILKFLVNTSIIESKIKCLKIKIIPVNIHLLDSL